MNLEKPLFQTEFIALDRIFGYSGWPGRSQVTKSTRSNLAIILLEIATVGIGFIVLALNFLNQLQ